MRCDPAISTPAFEAARRFFKDHYDVVTLDAGHFVHREDPEGFVEALLDWLR
ncbi:MAG: hypothetical protein ACNA8W_06545 [Bradymonadaceae bacterium]